MGTRSCATVEAPIHHGIKRAVVANDERATELLFRSYRNTARVARNVVAVEAVRIEREGNPFEAISYLVKGARGREGLVKGDPDHGIWTAGMVQGLIHDVPTVKQLVDRIVAEAEAVIERRLRRLIDRRAEAARPPACRGRGRAPRTSRRARRSADRPARSADRAGPASPNPPRRASRSGRPLTGAAPGRSARRRRRRRAPTRRRPPAPRR